MTELRFGVVYPQTEYPSDPTAIRDYAQTVEGLGYTHILVYDHVLGANPERPGGWRGPYTYTDPFQEPFTFFSYLAGLTSKIEFTTGIIILPQRQTALVAKQAATLDVLSGGRTRLGFSIGWNNVEYQALGENFHTRGKRLDEQLEVLKLLWTQPLVTYKGRWHSIPDAGLNPLPVQRPIPIWIGGHHEAALRRVACFGEGWMPNFWVPQDATAKVERLRELVHEAGRNMNEIGIEPRLQYSDPDNWGVYLDGWRSHGATHISINTMGCGFNTPEEHIQAIIRFAGEMGVR